MREYEDKLLQAIDEIVINRIEQLSTFNKTVKGKITQVLTAPKYEVQIGGELFTAKAINSATYSVGNVVYILVINNNFSEKIILCLVP